MCGIAGFIDTSKTVTASWQETARRMTASLIHRGPDANGEWCDPNVRVVLAHRRLAIIDLSDNGKQPMISESGRYTLVFNGEIYNFRDLRVELEECGHRFRGHSDTEVALMAIDTWGLDRAVDRFNGMFAFAVWDQLERVLYLVRDRAGEKPLYYGNIGGVFLFSSELKALKVHPAWQAEIDRSSVAMLLRYGYIPAPYSIYEGVYKLPPGCILPVRLTREQGILLLPVKSYWSLCKLIGLSTGNLSLLNEKDAVDTLEDTLREAVCARMVADVPLGAFLSGGIDSSTVVALMQAQSTSPIRTFTIGFNDISYDEARHASAVARHLGTEHTELYVSSKEAMEIIPMLPSLYDEPFGDASQIPTFLVSRLARQCVTVCLSGDGGDELFGGYNRHYLARSVWKRIGWAPALLRRYLSYAISSASSGFTGRLINNANRHFPDKLRISDLPEKLQKLARAIEANNPRDMYLRLVSQWHDYVPVLTDVPSRANGSAVECPAIEDFTLQMMFMDFIHYLPDDILVKLDRATMGVSLEARVPMLDPRVIEFAWRTPVEMKIRDGVGKWLLRQVLYRHVPRHLIERKKMGFGLPLGDWLRGPLRDWAEDLLRESQLRHTGMLDTRCINKIWQEHLVGKRDWHQQLWTILMFQAWAKSA